MLKNFLLRKRPSCHILWRLCNIPTVKCVQVPPPFQGSFDKLVESRWPVFQVLTTAPSSPTQGQWASGCGRPNNYSSGRDRASFVYELPEPTTEVKTSKIFSPVQMVEGIDPVSHKEAWRGREDGAWGFAAEFAWCRGARAPIPCNRAGGCPLMGPQLCRDKCLYHPDEGYKYICHWWAICN